MTRVNRRVLHRVGVLPSHAVFLKRHLGFPLEHPRRETTKRAVSRLARIAEEGSILIFKPAFSNLAGVITGALQKFGHALCVWVTMATAVGSPVFRSGQAASW